MNNNLEKEIMIDSFIKTADAYSPIKMPEDWKSIEREVTTAHPDEYDEALYKTHEWKRDQFLNAPKTSIFKNFVNLMRHPFNSSKGVQRAKERQGHRYEKDIYAPIELTGRQRENEIKMAKLKKMKDIETEISKIKERQRELGIEVD